MAFQHEIVLKTVKLVDGKLGVKGTYLRGSGPVWSHWIIILNETI